MLLKPTHKSVAAYYDALKRYSQQSVAHEGALRSAFQNLLDETGRRVHWSLIPELGFKVKQNQIEPDGTFRDDFYRHRGYWEAKDTDDDLAAEIRKKIARGYPLTNTIFEDTREAYLYQNGELTQRADLTDRQQLCDILNTFFGYTEPALESFDRAIDEFQERVPDLAKGLVEKIEHAHEHNRAFIDAFENFFELCKASLNPNLRREAVDEMLVQHLLTERLIRTIFDQPDFVRRNVIAAEVEKVIDALTSQTFSRQDFLKSLDRFYVAIEASARTIQDFSEKQHFLNTVYERFFQGYSVKVADTHGIVYTPQEIVDFMCASVVEVLAQEFGKKLGDPDVFVLDPCTGTGNFIVNLLGRVKKKDLPKFYREQLFANEVMLLPYYIASLNIEHAYFEMAGKYEPFEGICFVDTLDLSGTAHDLFALTEANTKRVMRQRKAPITLIIGNPPYNVGQLNENDNNKNRKYDVIDRRVKETYASASRATSVSKLNDPYVKFFRWATDRLGGRNGIVCFVSNNSFLDQIAFDAMRRELTKDFTCIYHLHLEGNVRQNPTMSGTAYNVFGIQVGVGITVATRSSTHKKRIILFDRVNKQLRRQQKLAWLSSKGSVGAIRWTRLSPDRNHAWLAAEHSEEFSELTPIGTKDAKRATNADAECIFKLYSLGVATHRDGVVYDFHRGKLGTRVREFVEAYNSEVDRFRRQGGGVSVDNFVNYETVVWDRDLKQDLSRGAYATFDEWKIRTCLYRPFTKRYLFFDRILNAEVYSVPYIFPATNSQSENQLIWLKTGSEWPMFALLSLDIVDLLPQGGSQSFPFYVYNEDGTNRRENITDWALAEFRKRYKSKKLDKWDIFHYVYGLLHHPGYRERYADNLKRELPRIPFAPDFKEFAKAGKQLAEIHLNYESLDPYELEWIERPGVPLSYHIERMKLAKDKRSLVVNDSLTLAGIPAETFDYRLGNRSALDWVIDQYRVKTDERSGITSDPNRDDDPEYIVRLVGQVIRVSVESVEIVNRLAELPFKPE
ncbi:MAG: type ISP restriction/modification enzyme [Planctomycetaceae bacterium]